ncbi:hypothetical protein ACF073_35535 [Streptomyces sp. NPDC015171]|uniref:hypothetical protein n=1 Tax=Streptomyces sp. NPDC015171 TaxID=3364945 RepID=UPI0036FD6ACB
MVEELRDGKQISAETVVLDDEDIRIAAITRTVAGPLPARQAVRHCVFAHDTLLHHPVIRQVVSRTVRALGITLGVLSVRMRLTPRGPRVLDVAGHIADDLIPLLVKRATGIDLPSAAADLATGRTPSLAATRQRAAAIQFLYPSATGSLRRLTVHPHADRHPHLDRIALTRHPGDHVTSASQATPDDRIAHIVALGPDSPACHSALDQIAQYIHADIMPTPGEPPRADRERHLYAWAADCRR